LRKSIDDLNTRPTENLHTLDFEQPHQVAATCPDQDRKIPYLGELDGCMGHSPKCGTGHIFYSQEKSGMMFHDVWGGYATPSDKPDIVHWVKKLSSSVPDDFAECFAETVTAGH
jgi:hypothetical protein